MGLVALLVWAALLLLVAACWKRLLGLAVSRFAQGRAFRLSVGQFLFGGVANVCLVLHVGPVRELRISRLSLGLATMPAAAATGVSNTNGGGGSVDSSTSSSGGELGAAAGVALGGGGLWQALLAGQLLMPVQLRGVHITLAPPSPRLLTPQQAGSRGQSAATSGGATARRSKAQLPLWLLEHLPMQLDGLTVVDEVRGVVLHLRHTSLSLHTAQRLVVQGLSAALCLGPDSANGASSEGGEGGSPRSGFVAALEDCFGLDSPPASSRGAAEQTPFLQLERLQLEHRHDGSFTLQQLAAAPAATAGTAAGVAGAASPAPAPAAMQALSMQLGAVSLIASRQLMQWMERQVSVEAAWRRRLVNQKPVPLPPRQPASCDEREAQQAEPRASRGRQQRLLRLLPLLPREAQVDVQSFSLATASSSVEGLPILADFTLKGIRCRLARAAGPVAAGLGSTSTSSTSTPLASISAGWQQLSASLGAGSVSATTPDEGGQQRASLPPAIALRSGAAEWSLDLSSEGQDQVAVAGSVMIGALGTDVCHPCVQPLVRQLLLASAAVKAALKPVAAAAAAAADASAGAAAAAAGEADGEAATVAVEAAGVEAVVAAAAAAAAAAGSSPANAATAGLQAAAQQPHRPPDSAARAPSLARWRCSLGLGDGSRLLFSDAAGRCCWSNSLASCRLTVEGGNGGTAALAAVSGTFEAVGIEMHALTAAAGSLAGTVASLAPAAPPPQMLAARLLRVQVEPPAPLLQQQQPQAQAYKQQAPKQLAGGQEAGLSVDATTAGVHLLMQQQQLAQVASVLASLLPPSSAVSSATSPAAGSPLSRAAQPDGDPLAAAVVAAAAAAAASGGKRSKRRLPPPRLTFSCTDSFLLLPTTVTVPAEQAAGGQLLLLPTAPALVLSSFAGKHGGGSGGSSVTVEGCCLLYCEGLASQRFPSSAESLKDQAKVQVLSVDRATFTQGPMSLFPESTLQGTQPGSGGSTPSSSSSDGTSGGSSGGGEGGAQLDIGCLSACADADALLCIVAVADHAAHQLAPVLAAATRDSGGRRGVARAPRQPKAKRRLGGQLCVTVGRVVAEQPLYTAGRDMAVEVTSLRVVVGDEAGYLHSLSTAATVLCMAGSPVLRWRRLEAALKLPRPAPGGGGGGTRLAALPLPPVPPPAGQAGAASAAARAVDDGLFPLDGQPPEPAASGQPPGSGSSSYEAYHRARLEAWLEADAATAPSGGAAQASGSGGGMGAAAAALGSGPASTLDVLISGAELIVPHDGEPGPTQRYLELYLKALQTAMAAHLQRIRLLTRRKSTLVADSMPAAAVAGEPQAKKTSSPLFPLQVNLVAERPALRFEHHPLEAWMSSRGPLLQQMAVQQHLWGEVAATVLPADTASPLHAGMVESAFETVAAASQQAWEGLLQDLLTMYRSKLQQADRERARQQWPQPQGEQEGEAAVAADSSGTRSSYTDGSAAPGTGDGSSCVQAPPGTDLMRIGVSRLQGLVVLCCGSEAARAAARQLIAATDLSAQRVPMCKLLKLHADLALDGFEMRLAGTSRPFVAASHVLISGTAAVARQATAPPQTRERQLAVGAHRTVAIPVTVKGCRPPFKFYTDLSLEAEALTVCHSQGLEPTMALVGLAGKRLSPSDPDKSVPRPPPIPWWDDLRYMWRGPLELSVSGFGLTLGGTANPRINETSERMEVAVDGLGGRLLSGCYELELQGLDVTLHRSAGVQQLGGTLLALPFVRAPRANVRLDVDWKLPGGRPAAQHHLFPVKLPPEADLQGPVYAGTVYKAEAWDLSLHVELGQTGDTDAGLPAAAAAVFLGGHQIQWMKQFVMMMGRMPPQLRAVARRGSFFWRKAPSGVPKKGIGKLTQKLCLDIVAAPLEVVHFAADPSDASHGIHLHAPSCTYTACYLLNQEPLSFLKLPPHAVSTRPRRPPATRTVTLSMDVQAGSVTVHKAGSQRRLPGGAAGSMSGGGSPLTSGASTPLARGPLAGPGVAEVQGEMLGLLDDLVTPFTREQQPIIAAGTVAVTQDGLAMAAGGGEGLAEALAPKGGRPLRVLISDCRVMVDRESRDAVWAAVAHLISAFTTNVTQQRRNLANAAVHPTFSLPASPSPTLAAAMTSPSMPWSASSPLAQLQRQVSESHAARSAEQPAPSDELMVPAPAPPSAHGSVRSSMDGGSLPASAAQQQQQQQLQSGPQQAQAQAQARGEPAVVPSGDSSNELLALLLQQRQESHDAGGQEESGSPLKQQQQQQEGQAGLRGGGPQHSGAEHQEEEEDEEALLSSPADDLSGQQKYVVEVQDLQICSEAEAAQGRLLLAARSGRLRGLHLPDAGLNVTALLMDEVSAYVSQMDVDPDAPVLWLQPTPEGYQVPAGQGLLAPVRRIFEPILISLRHSKLTAGGGGGAATRRRTATLSARSGARGTPGGPGSAPSGVRGEELVLRVPEVLAVMDSREFEVLVDVISMLQNPGPTVETVGAEAALLAELEGDEVEEARQLYALLRQQLAELRLSSLALRTSLGLHAFTSQLAPSFIPPAHLLPPLAVTHFFVGEEADFVALQFGTAAELAVAMREHLAAASAAAAGAAEEAAAGGGDGAGGEGASSVPPLGSEGVSLAGEEGEQQQDQQQQQQELSAADGSKRSTEQQQAQRLAQLVAAPTSAAQTAASVARRRLGERQQEQQQALLLRWVEEQEGGAFEAVEKTKICLLALKIVARKRQQKHSASRLRLQLDRVVWQMCTVAREPFVQASLHRLSLDKFQNKDHSGSAKFVIGRIDVLDSQGALGPGPGIGAGVILSTWNPDASWERDDMLRVVASMGVPTQTHIIYEHLDLILHPTAFHLTEGIAVAFWEYFFPKEDGSKARAAAAFARSVAVPAAAAARHRRSATALPSDMATSQQGSPLPGSPMRRTLAAAAAAGDGSSQPSSGGQSPRAAGGTPRGSSIVNAGWHSAPGKMHRRASSLLAGEGSLSRQSTLGSATAAAAAAAAAADASLLDVAADTAAALAGGGGGGGGGHVSFHLRRTSTTGVGLLQQRNSGLAFEHGGSGCLPPGVPGSTVAGGRLCRPLSSLSIAASEDTVAVRAAAAAPPHRKVRFVHVKLNRAHCRASYEGYPLTFSDLKLVIDNRTYVNIEGRWRDLFNKMKWDIVKSVVKSVAGFQGRKFKELLPEGFPGEDGDGGGRRKPGLFAQLQALGKGGRGKDAAAAAGAEEAAPSGEDLRSQYKRRMLFGHMALPSPTPGPSAGASAAAEAAAGAAVSGATAGDSPVRGAAAAAQPVQPLAPQHGGSGSPSAAAQAAQPVTPGTSALQSAAPSGGASSRGDTGPAPDDAAKGGSGPLAAGISSPAAPRFSPGPLASGTHGAGAAPLASAAAFGSIGSIAVAEPEGAAAVDGEDGSGGGGGGGGTDSAAAAAALFGQAPDQRGSHHLQTPRWAAKLASKAQKGLHKLRDSLQD